MGGQLCIVLAEVPSLSPRLQIVIFTSPLSPCGTLTSTSLSLLLYPLELVSRANFLSILALLSSPLVAMTQTEQLLHTADTGSVVKAPFICTV